MSEFSEQVINVANAVEQWAAEVRQVDDEPKFSPIVWQDTLDLQAGVCEPYTFGDLLDVIVLALRGIADAARGDES